MCVLFAFQSVSMEFAQIGLECLESWRVTGKENTDRTVPTNIYLLF